METKIILHILRNPYGHSEEEIKQARLEAADLLEKLTKGTTPNEPETD